MTLIPTTERTQYCFVDCGKEICECKPTKKIQMNKEKTAMQLLIGELDIFISNLGSKNDLLTRCQKGRLVDAKSIAKRLLQKEQEQIEMAFDLGVQSGMTKGYQNVGKDYYQSKYGGENVDR